MAQSQKTANSSFRQSRFRWKTDPTFYPTARLAMQSATEHYAYVAALAPHNKPRSDALLVVDVDAASGSYGKIVGQLDLLSPVPIAGHLARRIAGLIQRSDHRHRAVFPSRKFDTYRNSRNAGASRRFRSSWFSVMMMRTLSNHREIAVAEQLSNAWHE
jgi:selenium binding protein SBP56